MSSLYLHIPFCARRCPYCDFAVSVNHRDEFRALYVAALERELDAELNHEPTLETIYCGGGTPTELAPAVLNSLLKRVTERSKVASDAEKTLEANPEHLSPRVLDELQSGGWNRISLGAQSFDDAVLERLGRCHTGAQIERAVTDARNAGWRNLSLDLIFGAPLQSLESWRDTLRRAVALGVEHVSAYSLTIESGTAFGLAVQKGTLHAPDDDEQAEFMDAASAILASDGFERYEISNWAKPGFESRHNRNYWRGGDYIGVGCGAHSHESGCRWWNERDSKLYARRMNETGSARADEEHLSGAQRASELIALGLRSRDGFDLNRVRSLLNDAQNQQLERALNRPDFALEQANGRVWAKPEQWALADFIALRLLPD